MRAMLDSIVVREHVYKHGDQRLLGYVAHPPRGGRRPAVLVVHTAIGPHEAFISDRLKQVAMAGYVAFGVDMFGVPERRCVFNEEKTSYNAPFKRDRQLMASRMQAAVASALADTKVDADAGICAIGYCFGCVSDRPIAESITHSLTQLTPKRLCTRMRMLRGTACLDLARSPGGHRSSLRGVVSFHGILDSPPALIQDGPIDARVLCFHGHRDPFIPRASVASFCDEMDLRCAPCGWELHTFGGCYHAFTRPDKTTPEDKAAGLYFDARAAEQSWALCADFLGEVLS